MKTKFLTSLLIMLCLCQSLMAKPVSARLTFRDLGEEVDAYIQETMKRLPIPGLAVGIVKGDQVIYLQGYGTANTRGDPVTPQTPFMLASVTKTFTALAVQQLSYSGLIDLDAPVQGYISEFHFTDELASSTVTIRHLLDHTSGISTIEGTEPYLQSSNVQFDKALEQLARYTPDYQPGEHYEYSNWNYALLGEVISRVSGQPYVEYVKIHILDPLEMSTASFADYRTLPNAATGNLIVFGIPVPYDENLAPATLSAGGLNASVEDMTHYLIAYFNHGQYQEQNLLPTEGQGWFDTCWNWYKGMPRDVSYGFSGGHNSINTNIQLFSLHKVGVVILMNTRLDQLVPGPTANDVAFNIARLVIRFPYELPTNQIFYGGYAVMDVFLFLLIVSIIWQAVHLRYRPDGDRKTGIFIRIRFWLTIFLDLTISCGIFLLPHFFRSRWNTILFERPDFAIPILLIGFCLGLLGLIKIFFQLKSAK